MLSEPLTPRRRPKNAARLVFSAATGNLEFCLEGKGYPIGLLLSRVTICFNLSVGGYLRQVRRFNEWRKHASAAQLVTAYEPAVRLHLVRLA